MIRLRTSHSPRSLAARCMITQRHPSFQDLPVDEQADLNLIVSGPEYICANVCLILPSSQTALQQTIPTCLFLRLL